MVKVGGGWWRSRRCYLPHPPPTSITSPTCFSAMEARGIEPRSENDSEIATTCVDEACGLTTAAPRRPRQRQALRTSYMTRSGPRDRKSVVYGKSVDSRARAGHRKET